MSCQTRGGDGDPRTTATGQSHTLATRSCALRHYRPPDVIAKLKDSVSVNLLGDLFHGSAICQPVGAPGSHRPGFSGLAEAVAAQSQRQSVPAGRAVGPQRLDQRADVERQRAGLSRRSTTATSCASKGPTQLFQGTMQLIATSICKARPEDVDPDDFTLPDAGRYRPAGGPRWRELLRQMHEPAPAESGRVLPGRRRVHAASLRRSPAGVKNHHAYPGGLMEHVVEPDGGGRSRRRRYPVDRSPTCC